MSLHLGTDIESVNRFYKLYNNKNHLLKRLFYESEYNYANSKSKPWETLAGIWCAKEAVLKALFPLCQLHISQIEIKRLKGNIPTVEIYNSDLIIQDFEFSLSISHTSKYACASAIFSFKTVCT